MFCFTRYFVFKRTSLYVSYNLRVSLCRATSCSTTLVSQAFIMELYAILTVCRRSSHHGRNLTIVQSDKYYSYYAYVYATVVKQGNKNQKEQDITRVNRFKRFLLGFKILKVNYEIIFIIQNSKSLFLQEYSRNVNIIQTIST